MVLPPLVELIVLKDWGLKTLELWLVLDVVFCIILFIPLSFLICHIAYLRQVREMNLYCENLRYSKKSKPLKLPPEEPDEDEILRLKRNLEHFGRIAKKREESLLYSLKQIKDQCEKFQQLTDIDPLTKIFNRRYFEKIKHEINFEQLLLTQKVTLMLMDCDKFKSINDKYGHAEGDQVLVCLGRIIKDSVRKDADHPFRVGGDEFGVVLIGLDIDSALKAAERIRLGFLKNNQKGASLSIGLAEGKNEQGFNWEHLFQQADQALYQAKSKGGNRIVLWKG
jgi:diguanylate cyclase (GGDEF)-like protein